MGHDGFGSDRLGRDGFGSATGSAAMGLAATGSAAADAAGGPSMQFLLQLVKGFLRDGKPERLIEHVGIEASQRRGAVVVGPSTLWSASRIITRSTAPIRVFCSDT